MKEEKEVLSEQEIYDQILEKSGYPRGLPHLTKAVEKLMIPEEAEMLLKMPASPEELAEKWNMDEQTASAKVQEFMERGLVVPKGGRYDSLRALRDLALASNPKYVDQELQDLWREAWYSEEQEHFGMHFMGEREQWVRIIPNRLALQKSPPPPGGVLPEEDIEVLFTKARLIVDCRCPCRVYMRNCDRPLHCFQFNRSADYNMLRGSGVELSVECMGSNSLGNTP